MTSHLSSSAVHDVLRNPSLASEILSCVTQGPTIWAGDTPRRVGYNLKTCLSLALSRKWLLEPALDELWSRLNDLRSLVQLIPGLQYANAKIFTTEPISRSHLKRIEYHARRVKNLDICFLDNPRPLTWAEPSLFVQLISLLHGEPLLPCLSHLTIIRLTSLKQASLLSVILPLLPCGTLRQVALHPSWVGLDVNNAFARNAFSTLSFIAVPPVSQFLNAVAIIPTQALEVLEILPQISPHIIKILRQFPKLKRLSFPGPMTVLQISHFHHICILENLRFLKLGMAPTLSKFTCPDCPLVLHTLENLSLSSEIQHIILLFSSFKFPSLKNFICTVYPPFSMAKRGPHSSWEQYWDALGHLLAKELQSLEEFHIGQRLHTLTASISWRSFTPIHQLRSLTKLSLLGQRVTRITHEEFIELANSIPQLQVLQLNIDELSPTFLQFLIEVRTRLLTLEKLALPLDWRPACRDMLPDLSLYDSKHPLTSLNVLTVPPEHALEIKQCLAEDKLALQKPSRKFAEFLYPLFPNVTLSISPSTGIAGIEDYVMHHMAELKAKHEPETDSDSDASEYEVESTGEE
ncbi:hypothetical protein BJ165DRAFT_1595121 [Panaeolus papilionaceus]|nr:hypothetical protein BJ165DRAFT_1595121 [Panaeolus papilionaceus]